MSVRALHMSLWWRLQPVVLTFLLFPPFFLWLLLGGKAVGVKWLGFIERYLIVLCLLSPGVIAWLIRTICACTCTVKLFWRRSVIKKILILNYRKPMKNKILTYMLIGINLANNVLNHILGLRWRLHLHIAVWVLVCYLAWVEHGVKHLLLH